jgi:hypothetical protein
MVILVNILLKDFRVDSLRAPMGASMDNLKANIPHKTKDTLLRECNSMANLRVNILHKTKDTLRAVNTVSLQWVVSTASLQWVVSTVSLQ